MKNDSAKKKGLTLEPLARKLYTEKEMLQKEIADYLGVSEVTISKWSKKYNWDADKRSNESSPSSLIRFLYDQIALAKKLAQDEERLLTAAEGDLVSKLSVTISRLDKKIDPIVVIDVMRGFTTWLKGIDLDLAKLMVDRTKEYILSIVNNGQQ